MVVSIELTDKIDYTKKPLTLAEQVARLKQRGLVFDDESEATAYLFNISYYRLRAYTYPFQENGEDSEHTFTRKDIHFKDIIDLYCFDRRLRSLIFNTIEKIEVAVRTKIVQVYAESTGDSHWFNDESLYRFGYDDLMDRIDADVNDTLKAEDAEEITKDTVDTLIDVFRKALGKENLDVKVENLKNESVASMITLSEESRRMQDMMKIYNMGGMDPAMFGGAETLVLNAKNHLVQYILEHKDGEYVPMICEQLYDLAMLSHAPLSPEAMTKFIARSNEIMTKLVQ